MTISKGIALVTGAGQGIGRAIALRLASEGYDVALNDIPARKAMLENTAEEIASRARGSRVHCVPADVSSEKQVETMVSDVVNTFGGLDVVCTGSLPRSDMRNRRYRLMTIALTDGCKCRYLYDEEFCRQSVATLSQPASQPTLANFTLISYWGRPRSHPQRQCPGYLPLLQVRRYANDRTRPWWTHHR